MKSFKSRIILGSVATVAGLVLTGGSALAQISGTAHNLGSAGTGTNSFSGTAEICVFCHTPHGADTTASVPLWNRVVADPTTYTTYDSLGTSSLDGAIAPVGSVSIACLSCHDGTQAMNSVLNQPGSGASAPAVGLMTGTWTGPASSATPIGSLNYTTPSIVEIGQDLQNDHPIGIQYAGGGLTAAAPDGVTNFNDADFNATLNTVINTTTMWWVDTTAAGGTVGSRDKFDIQLYTRVEPTAANTQEPFVECASCHDPHTSNPTFLRISNDNSAVCLACHNK